MILNDLTISIIMAFVATFVETTFDHVDDNLSIPLFSGLIAQLIKLIK
jgi:dolichol kinase